MEYVEVVSSMGEDEYTVYILCCVYTSNYPSAAEEQLKKKVY